MTASRKPTEKKAPPRLSFRAFLEDAAFCNLELTPIVGAIADASEGIPVDLDEATCRAVFGCAADALPTVPRRTVDVSAGGRGGKSSRLLSPKALHAAWTVPLPDMRAGERGRSVLIAPDKDLADQDLDYVRGYAESSEVLRRALVPGPKTVVSIRRPWDGAIVDIRVGAANRGGKAARGRSMVFLGLDEAAFFFTDSSAAVTDKTIYQAGVMRIVAGGQCWIVSTPWIEKVGLLEQHIEKDFGKHERSLVVARVSTPMLRPNWDPTGEIEPAMREEDPENAAREIDAIPLAAGTSAFFDPVAVGRCFDLKPFDGRKLGTGVGFDAGLINDCTAAVAVDEYPAACFDASDAFELRPTRGVPLKPSVAYGGAAEFALNAGARAMAADGHDRESVREHASAKGVSIVHAPEGTDGKVTTYTAARKVMQDGRLRVSIADPALRGRLRLQLLSITKKPVDGGGIKISAPRKKAGPTEASNGHGDLVSALVLALWRRGAGKAMSRSASSGKLVRGGLTRGSMTRGRTRVDPRTGGPVRSRDDAKNASAKNDTDVSQTS